MNSFFIKNLISSSSNPQHDEEQQSDFERLIQLCNSYGLNEEQTKQLIEEFKKGSYKSATNSLNQSMMSQQNDVSMSQQNDHVQLSERNFQPQQRLQGESIIRKNCQQKFSHSNNFYQQHHQDQSTNRYYGYQNQMDGKDEQSYNQMTFNEQNNSLLTTNGNHFKDQQSQYVVQYQGDNRLRHDYNLQQKLKDKSIKLKENRQMLTIQHQLQRNNSKKDTFMKTNFQQQRSLQNENIGLLPSETNICSRESILTKSVSSQNRKNILNQSSKYQKQFQQTSKSSQNSNHQNSVQNQPEHELNHQYIRQLIKNFELLQKENQTLRQQNSAIEKKSQNINRQNESYKRQTDKLRKQLDEIKNKQKQTANQISKLDSFLQSQKQKSQMLLTMKQKDSQVIKGLKDSVIQLTQLLKEKDSQNNQLQHKLFALYDKLQKQTQYFLQQDFNHTGGSSFGKSGSRQSLMSQQSQKQINSQQKTRQKTPTYGRRQLNQMALSNINLPSNNQIGSQSSKQIVREPSISKINTIANNDQINMKKPQSQINKNRQNECDIKENIFTPLQVESNNKKNLSQQNNKFQLQDAKRRPSSRVDIKKYKGMIEQLRNSYSNVQNVNNLMR